MSIKIHYSFVFYIFILFFLDLILYYLIFFIIILIHEITHGLCGYICGLKVKNIEISINGLCLKFNSFNLTIYKKVLIYISGPLVNLALAIIVYLVFKEKYMFIVLTNLFLFIFNILPIYPLDGGKILYEVLSCNYSFNMSMKILKLVYRCFMIILLLIIAYMYINFYNLQMLFIGLYMLSFSNINNYENIIII